MYERILVPLDGSPLAEQVLPYVRALGSGYGSHIDLLRMFSPVSTDFRDSQHGLYGANIDAGISDQMMDYLNGIKRAAFNSEMVVSCTVDEGEPASRIVNEAEKESSTLIAMATHGRSGITRWMVGSVTDKVLHATDKPMLIVRCLDNEEAPAPAVDVQLTSVIVPLDGSPLAEKILPHVVAMGKALNLTVILVRVTPHFEADSLDYLRQVGEDLRTQGVPAVEERLLHGHAAASIVDFALEVDDNLVAMTTHGHSGIGRWTLGSVTDRVVRHSGDPVLVVRAHP